MVLFVNGCVRESSRTLELANAVLEKLPNDVEEIRLYPDGPDGLNTEKLQLRNALLDAGTFDHPMFDHARQFATADTIVIAAPYWDLAFPAKVRAYLEEVTVTGITFQYGPDGIPQGLCKADKLIYVMTSGGPVYQNFGFDYIKSLAQNFYGIKNIHLVKAEGLDIFGADPCQILAQAKQDIPAMLTMQQ